MAREKIGILHTDQLLSPANQAFIVIAYQPTQFSSIRSIPRDEFVQRHERRQGGCHA